jgi:hypothetical protein
MLPPLKMLSPEHRMDKQGSVKVMQVQEIRRP